MTTSEAATITELGTVGTTRFVVAETSTPWELDIDTIAVSVGAGVGILGNTLREAFPDAAWNLIEFELVDARHPRFFELAPDRRALLVNPREYGGDGSGPSGNVLRLATREAIRVAAEGGSRALGLPLLTAGMLNNPVVGAAEDLVSAAIEYAAGTTEPQVDRLVFFCMDPQEAQLITAEFARSLPHMPARPVGGLTSDLVDPNAGIPLSRDQLGVAPYVSMLATVIADRETPLPLSVGIFGAWGSGKSYFMAMLRERIDRLAGTGDRYCTEIVQIGFNAWHYTDSNLWASLGDEIFRQLAGSEPGSRERAEHIRRELARRVEQRRQLEFATREAGETAAALRAEIERATATRETTAGDLLSALRNSGEFRERIDNLWRHLGIADQAAQARLLAEEMHGTLTEAEALRRVPSDRRGRIALAAAVVVLLTGVLGALLAPALREWLIGLAGLFGLFAGTGVTWLARARSGVQKLREVAQDLHAGMRDAADAAVTEQMSDSLDRLRAAEAEQNIAQAQLDEVVTQVGELGRQLAALAPGRRLHNFIAERARSDAYSGNLGLISTVRKDFEQLAELMVEWQTGDQEWGRSRRPVDRIVLYIDDLDRCQPDQVVEVLQAVHLLLAFELFVVVVGVDPRWLLHSLRSSYADLLIAGGDDDPQELHRTPEDYLEKILNIPLVLPGMTSDSLQRLLRSLAGTDAPRDTIADPSPEISAASAGPAADAADTAVIGVERGSEVDRQQRVGAAPAPPHPLTEPELTLLGALDALIDTPREAKRLVNLYRMIRAIRDASEGSPFLGRSGRPGDYQAIIVLLGLLTAGTRLLGVVLDGPPDTGREVAGGLTRRPSDTPLYRFVMDLEPRPVADGWATPIAGAIPQAQTSEWRRLHVGLARVTRMTALTDLTELQRWLPLVRRFSYVLPPPGGWSGETP
ncbi:P-loop NTPase fold protein [Nocardia carnea]|uniref:P-loop NTPase fold protein n=1 Tax=Nocardia carnea TaxID=37328 RepID=UPI0024569C01|nr:P-loop NTPase fold protein [Nocardia carnea]